jgi:hypothetical protein
VTPALPRVAVRPIVTRVTVRPTTARVVVRYPGPQGIPGPPGTGIGTRAQDVHTLLAPQTVYTLAHVPIVGSVDLFLNGLQEPHTAFTVVGTTATITAFTPLTADTILWQYEY